MRQDGVQVWGKPVLQLTGLAAVDKFDICRSPNRGGGTKSGPLIEE